MTMNIELSTHQILCVIFLMFMTGCNVFQPAEPTTQATRAETKTPSPTSTPSATATPTPLPSLLPPATTVLTSTPLPLPTATETPVPTETAVAPTLPTVPPSGQTVDIFLVALEDAGRSGAEIGCGDSIVPVTVNIPPTRGVLRAALEALLALDEPYYGQSGLYNALHQSDLALADVTIINGEARIFLTGSLFLSGVCDNPRVTAQLEEIALQFSTVTSVAVFVNGEPLADVLSLQG